MGWRPLKKMGEFVNIYGASGQGKTQFILRNSFTGKELVAELELRFSRPAISLLPLSHFSGPASEYIEMFDIEQQACFKFSNEWKCLFPRNEMDYFLDRKFDTLSSGEKRRLDIFRCRVQSEVAIIDEPFANIDLELLEGVIKVLNSFKFCITLTHAKIRQVKNIRIQDIRDEDNVFNALFT